MIAIINANYDFAALLIEAGADPNIADDAGMAPLYAAVDMHRLAIGHGRPNPGGPTAQLDSVDIARLCSCAARPNAGLNRDHPKRKIRSRTTRGSAEGTTPFLMAAKSATWR